MQEYTRQIAYFYAYEQGRQEAAAGFVKAEVRSGRCRLGIHLNRLGRWEQGPAGFISISGSRGGALESIWGNWKPGTECWNGRVS